jgi:bifunctional non-homologous end joining protein LigD
VKAFAKAIAQFMTAQLPERFTATSGPKNRVGKIFIDYLRNARGASTVAAYSVRARPGLPVSVPISREELQGLRSAQQWSVANLQQRLDGLQADPWAGYANRQKITRKMWDKLGATPPA